VKIRSDVNPYDPKWERTWKHGWAGNWPKRDQATVGSNTYGDSEIAKLSPGAICGHSRKRRSETVGRCGESRRPPGQELGNTPENEVGNARTPDTNVA
jgi:hypothetical protein